MFSINQEFCLDPDAKLQETLRSFPVLAAKQAREHCSQSVVIHDAVVGTAYRAYPIRTFNSPDRNDRVCGFVTGSSLALLAFHYASHQLTNVSSDEVLTLLPPALQQLNPHNTEQDNTDTFINSAIVLDHVLPSAMALRRSIKQYVQPPDFNPATYTMYATASVNGFSFTASQLYTAHQALTQQRL